MVGPGDGLEPIEELQFQNERELKGETEQATSVLEFGAAGRMMQAEVADADKTIGQDMREEATDEFGGRQGHELLLTLIAIIVILESDRIS